MKIIFFGTPYYVIPILEALNKGFRDKTGDSAIVAVVTQSPKPAGRKQKLEYSEVDKWAHTRGVPIFFNSRDLESKNIKADVGIVASYGAMIPTEVIKHFQHGIIVIHPSLLPNFRWASPVPAALVTGVSSTGVTIIKMDDKWDHGPIITQAKEDISENDTYGSLRDRLFESSGEILVEMLPAYIQSKINLKPQDDTKASYARMIKKEDAFIPPKFLEKAISGQPLSSSWDIDFIKVNGKPYTLDVNPHALNSFIRAMDPWPTAWTEIKFGVSSVTKRLKIVKSQVKNSKLVLDVVQLEGKNPVSWEQFRKGYPSFSLA